MSDLPMQGLLQQMNAHQHSGEYLEVLGKRAAARWSAGDHKTLNDAVTETVKQAQLSPEQVKRVVEFANTSAYLDEFRKEGAPHRVVDFPGGPADPSAVLQDLNDGGGGSVYDRGTGDYDAPPAEHKTSSSKEEEELLALFGKEASAELPYENPHGEVIDLKDKLAGAAEHLRSQIGGLEVLYADLADRVYQQVKQAALGGVSLGEVVQAWETVSPSADHIKVAFTLITPRLLRDGVFHGVEEMTSSVDKTASARMVNPEHLLVVEFGDFCDALSKLAELREARSEINEHLNQLNNYVKTAAGGLVGKSWELAGRAGRALRPLGNVVGGETGATIAQHAPQVALGVGGLMAAHEANKAIEAGRNPATKSLRWAKHKVLQHTPGTEDYYAHQYEGGNYGY